MRWRSSAILALACVTLAACGGERPRGGFRPVSDTPVKIGVPYRAGGRTWVPRDDRSYDAVGFASWYGRAHAGRPTANGERFDPRRISAAHPTLPLPSYVEVTALDTGRTILVRINDRGPFVSSRIIDLSESAARALGVMRQGVARVRVRRVEPSEGDRAALRAGRTAGVRSGAASAPPVGVSTRSQAAASTGGGQPIMGQGRSAAGVARQQPLSAAPTVAEGTALTPQWRSGDVKARSASTRMSEVYSGPMVEPSDAEKRRDYLIPRCARAGVGLAGCAIYVDVASFDDADRADGLAMELSRLAPARVKTQIGAYSVRLGPFRDKASAQATLESMARAGYQEARIVRESAETQEP